MRGLVSAVLLVTLAATGWVSVSRAADLVDQRRYLVASIETGAAEAAAAQVLEEALVLELGRRAGVQVVTSAEMKHTVEFATKQAELGCDQVDGCIAAVREQLAVAKVISGRLGRLGAELVLTFRVIDTASVTVPVRATVQASDLAGLKSSLPRAVDELLGSAAPSAPFRLAAGEALSLAVMPLAARGVPDATSGAMTQILSAELNQIAGVSVLSEDDIRAMLDKTALEAEIGCTDNLECIAEIGAALGVSTLVSGAVGKVGTTFVLSLQLIDSREATVKNRVLEAYEGDARELANVTKLAAHELVGHDVNLSTGRVDLSFDPERAEVRFAEKQVTLSDGSFRAEQLVPGRYSLRVLANTRRFFPLQTDVYVAPGSTTIRSFELRRRPTPWYRSWWFWTLTGAVVAGATSATVVLATGQAAPLGTGTVVVEGG